MKIPLNDLKAVFKKILTKIKKPGITEIEVGIDYYWVIMFADLYDFKTTKPKIGVGSFIDDWGSLKKILFATPNNDYYANSPTSIDYERLGNILKIIANEIRKQEKPCVEEEKKGL